MEDGMRFLILYEFIEGEEVEPRQDAESLRAFVGKLHQIMHTKRYDRVNAFITYGDALWERVRDPAVSSCSTGYYH